MVLIAVEGFGLSRGDDLRTLGWFPFGRRMVSGMTLQFNAFGVVRA
jgi:hypothetical protein